MKSAHVPSVSFVAWVGYVLAVVGTADAGIVTVGGNATLIDRPADARLNALTSNTTAFVWNEAQNVRVASPITINGAAPGLYSSSLSFDFGNIGAGSVVSSHFIHFDSVGSSSRAVDGSVTFDADIVGVIAWNRPNNRHLDASDAVFGLGTLFSTNIDQRGVFDSGDGSGLPQGDEFTISADSRMLSFHLEVSSPYDEIRVLTVPEPGALFLLALGGVVLLRRPRRMMEAVRFS